MFQNYLDSYNFIEISIYGTVLSFMIIFKINCNSINMNSNSINRWLIFPTPIALRQILIILEVSLLFYINLVSKYYSV